MAKITLKPLDDGQKAVEIPVGKTTIGRGPFLGCGDKKVSRNHAVLEVTDQGEVYLTPTHVNPCFFQPTADNPGTILKKDKPHKLENGDSFSLLPRAFRYKLVVGDDIESGSDKSKHSPKEEEKVNGMVEEKTEMDTGESNASENPPIKEKVNGEPAFSSKEQKESVAASSGIPSRVEEHKSFDAKSNVEMNGGNSQDAIWKNKLLYGIFDKKKRQRVAVEEAMLEVVKKVWVRDEWTTFGDFVANEGRALKSETLKRKLKVGVSRLIADISEEDDDMTIVYSSPEHPSTLLSEQDLWD